MATNMRILPRHPRKTALKRSIPPRAIGWLLTALLLAPAVFFCVRTIADDQPKPKSDARTSSAALEPRKAEGRKLLEFMDECGFKLIQKKGDSVPLGKGVLLLFRDGKIKLTAKGREPKLLGEYELAVLLSDGTWTDELSSESVLSLVATDEFVFVSFLNEGRIGRISRP